MELSNINVQAKIPVTNASNAKSTSVKDNDNNFSTVYKQVNDKANNDSAQTKSEPSKEENNSVDSKTNSVAKNTVLNEKAEEGSTKGDKTNTITSLEDTAVDNSAKDDKDLNKLIELLLMSGNINHNLMSLLNSSGEVDTKEIEAVISKMLRDNISGSSTSSFANSFPSDLSTKNNTSNLISSANGDTSLIEISKMLSTSNQTLDETIEKLSADIASRITTDNSLRKNLVEMLVEKANDTASSINVGPVKELIIDKLKAMTENRISAADNKDLKVTIGEDTITAVAKEDLSSNFKAINQNSNNGVSEDNYNKSSSTAAGKDDELLKQLLNDDSSNSSKDSISDKIANVLNRFEALKVDNQPLAEGKLTINKATLNEDMIKAVKFMDLNNIKELSVKVIPKDLGEIVIRLSLDNGVMKANITAANKDTYNLLNSQLPAINSELSKQNMTIQNFSLSLYNGENFLFNGDGSRNENGKKQGENNVKVDGIEDLDVQNELYSEDNSRVNILA